MRRSGSHTALYLAAGLLVAIGLFGVLGPALLGRGPHEVIGGRNDPPSGLAWLGTDSLGHDVLTVLAYGTRSSLIVGFVAGAIATLIGLIIGTAAGYLGGVAEEALMAVTNVVLVIPTYLLLILVAVGLESRSVLALALVIGLTTWPWTARAVRAQVSSLRVREHMDTARLSGSRAMSMIMYDILPFMLAYVVMAFALQVSSAVLAEAALALLGLGPSTGISLGVMLNWALAAEAIRTGAWWTFGPPAILLTLFAFALLTIQASMDDVLNPRLRRQSARIRRTSEPMPASGQNPSADFGDVLTAGGLRAAYATRSGETVALDGVSLSLPRGEVLGIAGESGCGKSTLAAVLSLTAQPPLFVLDGALTIAGRRLSIGVSDEPQSGQRGSVVSLLPQVTASSLPPIRRVGDFAADVLRTHRPDTTREEAMDYAADRLGRLGLPRAVLGRYPHQLSGGMSQRVVIGLSTLLDPAVLIADEPTSALDVSSQQRVMSLLREQLAAGLVQGILFITHDLPVLGSIANRVAIMYAGQIVEQGSTEEVLNQPQHPYTRALLASVLVPDESIRTHRVAGIDGSPPDLATPPTGCRFHPRCPLATDLCRTEAPPAVGSTHRFAACWRADDRDAIAV